MGTHPALGGKSHTAAYTPKQGLSLPQPQCGFVPPVKSLLLCHAFIYIHFPVLCEPSLSATALSQTIFHRVFNFSHKRPTFAFTHESGYTPGFRRRIAHKGTHGETGAVSDGGWYHYPQSVPHVSETLRGQGVERQTLPLLGLGRRHSRRTQRAFGTAMRSCASLFRGVAAPLGCVILSLLCQ